MASIATLQRLPATKLSDLLLAEATAANSPSRKIAIVDVRDDDHIGGHIKGSMNFPSRSLDAMLPTLLRKLEDKETVIFYCALSQQRGPGAALRYIRERDGRLPSASARQKVYVLDRGFVGWQELYGEDERLTEAYRKEIWQDGF